MDFKQYQADSSLTDQFPTSGDESDDNAITIPLFGVIGEVGSLVTCIKKRLRDGPAYEAFEKDIKEEMGDILWYLTNLATKWDISLEEIAQENIIKTRDRWPSTHSFQFAYDLYDDDFAEDEQIPRNMVLTFQKDEAGRTVVKTEDGFQIGDPLTDNSYESDGYRFHDIFHFAFAAILGWSPVVRSLMNRKRKSAPQTDEIQDGARARIIEEAVSFYVFSYAKTHNLLKDVSELDQDVLKTIKNLTDGLEVKDRTMYEWKEAIFRGYELFRYLNENDGGRILFDMRNRKLELYQ